MVTQDFHLLHIKVWSDMATPDERKQYADVLIEAGRITPDEHKSLISGKLNEDEKKLLSTVGLVYLSLIVCTIIGEIKQSTHPSKKR